MEVLLFGGTWEGRTLSQRLARMGISVVCSVATEYGAQMMDPEPNLSVRTGRLDQAGMVNLLTERPFACVVDATHPYAVEVSAALRQAAWQAAVPYRRLLRPREEVSAVHWVESPQAAAEFLDQTEGAILLTTGSKELAPFLTIKNARQRLWVRVLPSMESLQAVLHFGIPARQIICMQGPFSVALNAAMLQQIHAHYLVTKDSGKAGGFTEKVEAAQQAGATLVVIARPEEEGGYSMEALLQLLREEAER